MNPTEVGVSVGILARGSVSLFSLSPSLFFSLPLPLSLCLSLSFPVLLLTKHFVSV